MNVLSSLGNFTIGKLHTGTYHMFPEQKKKQPQNNKKTPIYLPHKSQQLYCCLAALHQACVGMSHRHHSAALLCTAFSVCNAKMK